jgi:hypothetical protein
MKKILIIGLMLITTSIFANEHSLNTRSFQLKIADVSSYKELKIKYGAEAHWRFSTWLGETQSGYAPITSEVNAEVDKDGVITLQEFNNSLPLTCLIRTCEIQYSILVEFDQITGDTHQMVVNIPIGPNLDNNDDFNAEINSAALKLNGSTVELSRTKDGHPTFKITK